MNAKLIGIIVLLVLLAIFVVQNTQSVVIKFLFWGHETSAVVTILVSFFIGVLVGGLVLWVMKGKKKDSTLPSRSGQR